MPKKDKGIAKKGHNTVGGVAQEQLLSIIKRIENLLEEKANISEGVKDIKAEAKGNGFDVKAIMVCVKQRAMDADEREEQELIIDTYRAAVGLIPEFDDLV